MDEQQQEQQKALDEIVGKVAGLDPEAFARALHKAAQQHYQTIFNAGHRTATGQYGEKEKEFAAQIEALQGQIAQRDAKIKELAEATPDVKTIREKYEKALTEKDAEWQAKATEWQQKVQALETGIRQERLSGILSGVVSELQRLGVEDADYARIRAHDPELVKRIQFTDDGRATGYQKDGVTPYSLPEGERLSSILAKELLPTIPKVLIRDNRPASTGLGNPNGNPAPAGLRKSTMTPADKVRFIEANGGPTGGGLKAYEALPA